MKPWERYAQQGGESAPWLAYGDAPEKSIATKAGEVVRDLGAGAVRGAASIGATLLTPIDAAARAVGVENSIIGRTDRREATDAALQSLGADTDSTAYQVGKVGAEVAGTLGVGGAVANAAARIPAVARAARAGAKAIEDALEVHLQSSGQGALLRNFREARQLIAKTYSIEKAMTATGTIDARKLAAELKKGKPLTGELRQIAEFGSRFPKAAQTIEQMGSLPQTSPLDFYGAGGLAAMLGDPLALSAVAVRPAMRATALSPMVQNALIQPAAGSGALSRLPVDQAALLGMRAAPVIGPSSSGR